MIHTIEHLIQNQRKQFHRIKKLKRKFDDLFRKMKNYFRKLIEILNNRNSILNRDYMKNRDRIKNQNHNKNRNKNREKKILKIAIKSTNIIIITIQFLISKAVVVEIKTKNINKNENFIINRFSIQKKKFESYLKNENECLRLIKFFFRFIRNIQKRIKNENENKFEIEKIFENFFFRDRYKMNKYRITNTNSNRNLKNRR